MLRPLSGQSCVLRAHDKRHGSAQVRLPEGSLGGGSGQDRLDAVIFEKHESPGIIGHGHGQFKDGSLGSAHGIRIKWIGDRVGEDEGIGASGIGGAENGSEIARLLDSLKDDQQRVGGERQLLQAVQPLSRDCQKTVRSLSRGGFGEGILG